MTFVNNATSTVYMNWHGYDGNEVAYGAIQPGETMDMNTYVTHPWSAIDEEGNILVVNGVRVWTPAAFNDGDVIEIREIKGVVPMSLFMHEMPEYPGLVGDTSRSAVKWQVHEDRQWEGNVMNILN